MWLNEAIGRRLAELMSARGLTQRTLEKKSGVARSTIRSILRGEPRNIRLSTLLSLCGALGIKLSEFFDAAVFIGLK